MFETLDFSFFSGSFRRASEPGAPFSQSGATGRSSAARAEAAIAKVIIAARAVRFMGNSGINGVSRFLFGPRYFLVVGVRDGAAISARAVKFAAENDPFAVGREREIRLRAVVFAVVVF